MLLGEAFRAFRTAGEREGGRSSVIRGFWMPVEEVVGDETARSSASQRGRGVRVPALRVWPGVESR
jgi:hypothetical protein